MHKATLGKAETTLLAPFRALTLECIITPVSRQEFAAATAEIFAAGVAGFDTESKPLFNNGEISDGPHVVQFALQDKAFIFQLNRPECRLPLIELLQSSVVLKAGFGLESDRAHLHRTLGVKLASVLDLNHVFRRDGYGASTGVRAAVAIVLNQKFHKSKRVTTSNWAAAELSDKQLIYAANDAYAALQVLLVLERQREDLPISGLIPGDENNGASD